MSQPHGFWEQYKENVREHNRQAPWRIVRLLVAFGLTLLLAPCCAAAAAITGEPMAAMVVAVVGIVAVVVAWRVIWWLVDRSPNPPSQAGLPFQPSPPAPQYPAPQYSAQQFPAPQFPAPQGFIDAQLATAAPARPIMGAGSGPVPPFAAEPVAHSSGIGWGCALAGVFGAMMLFCCGGGALGLALLPGLRIQAGPNQANVGGPVGFQGPFGGPGGDPIMNGPMHDPFAEMHRQHQKQFDELMRENERQMRELNQQIGPDF